MIAIDIETTVKDGKRASPYQDEVLIISVNEDGKIWTTKDPQELSDILNDSSVIKVFHNGVFDLQFLCFHCFDVEPVNIWDTMVAERLLTAGTGDGCGLNDVVERYCGVFIDKTTRKTFMHHSGPLSSVQISYAKGDVEYLLDIAVAQQKAINERGMDDIMSIENRLVPVVADMALRGIGFDPSAWDEIYQEETRLLPRLESKAQELLASNFELDIFTGEFVGTLNLNSTKQLLAAFRAKGFSIKDTQESTLKKLACKESRAILEYRDHAKRLQWDYPKYINPSTGRIHPSFVQTGADTGRFSCKKPNLQNVPKDKKFRRMFIARPGYKLVSADYGQQELRVLAEVSQDPKLIEVCREADPHLENAKVIYSDDTIIKSDPRRDVAKGCGFALAYGASAKTFAHNAGISAKEGAKAYKLIHKTYSRVDAWALESWKGLCANGFVMTLGGRRRYFPRAAEAPGKYMTVGRNTPIQGTSADMMKLALVLVTEALQEYDAGIVLSVHDEIVVEVVIESAKEVAKIVEDKMVAAADYYVKSVPNIAEAVISDTWTK